MPRYKLMFENASWQDRKFISLTKIEEDGRAFVLNAVIDTKDGQTNQMSFGNYAHNVQRGMEFTHRQTTLMNSMMGNPIAEEALFAKLLNENILERIFNDKGFLKNFEQLEKERNHPVLIQAAQDLQKRICKKSIGKIDSTYYPEDYRAYVFNHYIDYLLNLDGVRINAHPEGLFTEIHVARPDSSTIQPAKVNSLPVDTHAALAIRRRLEALAIVDVTSHTGYYFLGVLSPYRCPGNFIEITEPTTAQMKIVDNLFAMAERDGFFPKDSKKIICDAWNENCSKAIAAPTSSWSQSSPTLLAAPRATTDDDDQADVLKQAAKKIRK